MEGGEPGVPRWRRRFDLELRCRLDGSGDAEGVVEAEKQRAGVAAVAEFFGQGDGVDVASVGLKTPAANTTKSGS